MGGWPVVQGNAWNFPPKHWQDVVQIAIKHGLAIGFPFVLMTMPNSAKNTSELILRVNLYLKFKEK
jgi:hypothetical protein